MAAKNFRILNNAFLNKDPDVVTYQTPQIILDSKSALCMANNDK